MLSKPVPVAELSASVLTREAGTEMAKRWAKEAEHQITSLPVPDTCQPWLPPAAGPHTLMLSLGVCFLTFAFTTIIPKYRATT